jgi:predicted  nucleic acid-binding Zn-ribbon protein
MSDDKDETITRLQAELRVAKNAISDAFYVLEGSRAIESQSDELLEKRAQALMRFFEAHSKLRKVGHRD